MKNKNIFVAVEHSDRGDPVPMSMAMAAYGRGSCYVELDPLQPDGAYAFARSSRMVRDLVIGQMRRKPRRVADWNEMGERLARWLARQMDDEEGAITLAYEWPLAYEMACECMSVSREWRWLKPLIEPLDISSVMQSPLAVRASQAYLETRKLDGLDQYHAWVEARALRASFKAARPLFH